MPEYIEREVLRDELLNISIDISNLYGCGVLEGLDRATKRLNEQLAADVVPKSLYDQTAWERDLAIKQLREDYGVGLGEKKKDVSQVRHGRWMDANSRAKTYQRRCTACGGIAYFCGIGCSYNYCPNCGAKMDGAERS